MLVWTVGHGRKSLLKQICIMIISMLFRWQNTKSIPAKPCYMMKTLFVSLSLQSTKVKSKLRDPDHPDRQQLVFSNSSRPFDQILGCILRLFWAFDHASFHATFNRNWQSRPWKISCESEEWSYIVAFVTTTFHKAVENPKLPMLSIPCHISSNTSRTSLCFKFVLVRLNDEEKITSPLNF